jgi:hypothetical protein
MDDSSRSGSRRSFVAGLSSAGALAALGALPRALAAPLGGTASL